MAAPEQVLLGAPTPGYGAPEQHTIPEDRLYPPALECLKEVRKVEVQEKVSLIEAATALLGQEIEMPNCYKVFADGDSREIFYAVEQTNFLARNLKQCCNECAPWDLHILHTEAGKRELAFQMQRPFSCTCCCINRPEVTLYDATNGEEIGSVTNPWTCCALDFTMKDAASDPTLSVHGGCCQLGLWCPCPCGPCSEVHFPVTDATSGVSVAKVTKKVPGCLKWLFADDVDNYKIDFGSVMDPRWKAMLVALSIFIDYRFFNDNSADKNKDR